MTDPAAEAVTDPAAEAVTEPAAGTAAGARPAADRLRAVLDTLPDASAILRPLLDADGRYVDAELALANRAWLRLFLGRDADEAGSADEAGRADDVEGRSVYALVPGMRSRIELHRHTWATGEPFRGIVLLNVPGGQRWAELTLARAGDELVATTRDITAQRQTEIALTESREMLRGAMDAVIEGYAIYRGVTDADGRYIDATVVYANDTWMRQYSPGDEDVEGRSLYSFPGARARFDLHAEIYETGEPFRGFVEAQIGGETHVLDLQMVRFGRYIVGSSRDITDQRRAEAALHESERRHREVVDGIDAIVWDNDLVTGESFMSRRVETLTGYPAEDFARFEVWSGLLHPDDRERAIAAITGTDDVDIEYRLRVHSGAYRWFRDRTHVLRDAEGTPIRRYGISIDVTERRELEERVRRSERFSSVGQLAANVSHDFDNVLYGISMFADHLLRTHPSPDDPVHEDADAIVRAVQSASGLTSSLLAFARAQPTTAGRVIPDEVVRRLEPMLGAVVGSRIPIRLGLHAPSLVVVGEASALEQAVLNLCINARDAMPSGGTLTLSTRVVTLDDEEADELETEPGRGVLLDVVDTGTGMDDETRSRAFEPYFTTKPVGKGTGLGLATVFGTVKASGGGIGIISAPGHGTTIRIFLAAAPAAGAAPRA